MKGIVEKVRSQALVLSPSERASLAHDLILSLDEADSLALSAHTEAEIGRRVELPVCQRPTEYRNIE